MHENGLPDKSNDVLFFVFGLCRCYTLIYIGNIMNILHFSSVIPVPHNTFTSTYGSALGNENRFQVEYFVDQKTRALISKTIFLELSEGPPGHVHGGCIAAAHDEVMGGTAWINEYSSVLAELKVSYKKKVPLNVSVITYAWVIQREEKKVRLESIMTDDSGTIIYSEGSALFISIDPKTFAQFGKDRIEAAKRFIHGVKNSSE